MTSEQGRLYKTYCQLVKSQYNFLQTLGNLLYVRNAYIQIQMDSDIKHVF